MGSKSIVVFIGILLLCSLLLITGGYHFLSQTDTALVDRAVGRHVYQISMILVKPYIVEGVILTALGMITFVAGLALLVREAKNRD